MITSFYLLGIAFFFLLLYKIEKYPIQKAIFLFSSLAFVIISIIEYTQLQISIQNYNYETLSSNTVIKNITTTYIYTSNNSITHLGIVISLIIIAYILALIYEIIKEGLKEI